MGSDINFYSHLQAACDKKGISMTRLITDCGFASSNIARIKEGSCPRIDMVAKMARHLGMGLDELVYGEASSIVLCDDEEEMLSIYRSIPDNKHEMCKDFLRTHVASYEMKDSKK